MRKVLLAVLAVLCVGQAAQAALVLNVGSGSAAPGGDVTIDVWLSQGVSDSFSIDGYTVGLKLTPTNTVTVQSFGEATVAHPRIFTNDTTILDLSGSAGYNPSYSRFLADDGPSTAVNNATRNGLFSITYHVDASTPAGNYSVAFDPALTELANAGSPLTVTLGDPGTISIVVPEPASLGLALLGLPLVLRRRR